MLNYFLFILISFFWGGSFVAIKYLIEDVPSFTSAFYRVFFSIIFLFIIYLGKLKLPKGWWGKELIYVCITGLCSLGIPFALLFWGERYVSPSMAGVLNGTVPFWTLIVSLLLFDGTRNIDNKKVIGLILGFIGITLIFGPKVKMSGDENEILGLIAILSMAFSYSIGINLNKRILSSNKIIVKHTNTIIQQIVSALFLLMTMLTFDGVPDLSLIIIPKNLFSIIYLSLFSTCIAFIIFYHLIHEFGAVKASTVTFFVPPIALGLDAIIYGQRLSFFEMTGAAIIILSMFFLKDNKKQTSLKSITDGSGH